MHESFNRDHGALYQFGDFTLHAGERRMTRRGEPVHVSPRTFDVLAALLQRAGRLVTKRQLLECVWGSVCVEPGILTVHVAALRKIFGDSRSEARYIETVSGYGYRFIASVHGAIGRLNCPPGCRAGVDSLGPDAESTIDAREWVSHSSERS